MTNRFFKPEENMDELDECTLRTMAIFDSKDAAPTGCRENLLHYREYLLKHLDRNEVLEIERECFWEPEDRPTNKADCEEMKKGKDNAYTLHDITTKEYDGDLIAQIKRISDGKIFEIDMYWVMVKNQSSPSFQILDDYRDWVANAAGIIV